MGVTIVREFARLRIRRVPFIGVPREFVRDRARGRRLVQEVPAHGRHAGDFFGVWASGSDVPERGAEEWGWGVVSGDLP